MSNSAWKQQVAKGFGNAAHRYDDHSPVQRTSAKHLAGLCPALSAGTDVLEIGCGTGALTRHLIAQYPDANLHITDLSAAMLRHAQTRIDTPAALTWDVMDGEHPRSERRYDLIVSNMAMQWFEDRTAALGRLSDLLKPNGVILYSVPGPQSFSGWRDTLRDLNLPSGILEFETPETLVDEQQHVMPYDSAHAFLKSIKQIGAHKPKRGYAPLSPAALRQACRAFDARFDGQVNWHILYGEHRKGSVEQEKTQ